MVRASSSLAKPAKLSARRVPIKRSVSKARAALTDHQQRAIFAGSNSLRTSSNCA